MKFFAFSALATIAAAGSYSYGGASSGLSTGYTTGYSTGYNTLSAPAYATVNTVAVPAVQKFVAVAQPAVAVQKVALTGYTGGYASGYTYGQAAVAPLAVQSTHQVRF